MKLPRMAEAPSDTVIERFAPSPTGPLHLGHAYSALLAHDAARTAGGRFLLRLEDLDAGRVRPGYAADIVADLAWLGIEPDAPPLAQSARFAAHGAALENLSSRGLVYRCACSRRDIRAAAAAPQEGVALDGVVYPGTCRTRPPPPGQETALRLDLGAAIDALGGTSAVAALRFREIGHGPNGERGEIAVDPVRLVTEAGDVVLQRRDGAVAYHLAVVLDDAFQGVTHVTRGEDLFAATALHRLLQALFDLPAPVYRHHRLIRDATGRRLAKRDDARSLAMLRAAGWTPAQVRRAVGLC